MIKQYKDTGYFVDSEKVCVYSKYNGGRKPLKPKEDRDGYLVYGLTSKGKTRTIAQHRIMLETFCPNPNEELYTQINHIDGIKSNNKLINLEWCTPKQNMEHLDKTLNNRARGEKAGSILTEDTVKTICTLLEENYRICDIAKLLGLKNYLISTIYRKQSWTHISKNYSFEYIPQQGISMNTFKWVCYQLQDKKSYRQILDMYTGGDYLTYTCLKRIKSRKMRGEHSKQFNF